MRFHDENRYDAIIEAELAVAPTEVRSGLQIGRLDLATIKTLIGIESGFVATAVNPEGTGNDPTDDSYGLGQVNIRTARKLATRNYPDGLTGSADHLLDPRTNLEFMVTLVADLWWRYAGDPAAVAASYNAGMHRDGSLKKTPTGQFVNQGYVDRFTALRPYFMREGARRSVQLAGADIGMGSLLGLFIWWILTELWPGKKRRR